MPARIRDRSVLEQPVMTRLHREDYEWIYQEAQARNKKPAAIVRECVTMMRQIQQLKSAS